MKERRKGARHTRVPLTSVYTFRVRKIFKYHIIQWVRTAPTLTPRKVSLKPDRKSSIRTWGINYGPPTLYSDNQASITLVNNEKKALKQRPKCLGRINPQATVAYGDHSYPGSVMHLVLGLHDGMLFPWQPNTEAFFSAFSYWWRRVEYVSRI